MAPPFRVVVENFGQIARAEVAFGDLTVLVGPQGSGKSLLLQLFKLGIDPGEIMTTLKEAGHDVSDPKELLDLYLGQGMSHAWTEKTRVSVGNRQLNLRGLSRSKGPREGKVFFVPAHRALLLSDGWPAPFQRLGADTPTVARLFSQRLYELFANPHGKELFPVERWLKKGYRDAIDDAVFHGGRIVLEKEHMAKRLGLVHGRATLPFMTWTAGQREFTPMLLGLYHLLPPRKITKQKGIDWVVIEEPEMGLHPQAVTVVMLLVLDLLWRGYRVVLSSHSPLVVEIPFMLRTISGAECNSRKAVRSIAEAFGVSDPQVSKVLKKALTKSYQTTYMKFQNQRVRSMDISELDPAGDDDEAGWGGLTQYSGRFQDAVARCVG